MKIWMALAAGGALAFGGLVFGLSGSDGKPMPEVRPGALCGVEGEIGARSDRVYVCLSGVWQARLDRADPAR